MNTIKIKNKEYNLISNWDEVNITKFEEIVNISEAGYVGMRRLVEMIAVISDVPKELLEKSSADSIASVDINWMSKPMEKDLKPIIEVKGEKFGLVKDLKNLTLGEYADLDTFAAEKEAKHKNLHKIAAILYRPIISEEGDKYEIEEYSFSEIEERSKLFAEVLSIQIINAVASFFLTIKNGS